MRHKIIKLKRIDSTHKFALRMIESVMPFECGVIAETQTDGVGRYGRKWESSKGSLFASVIKNFPSEIKNMNSLSLAAGCAVREAVGRCVSNKNDLHLHWPNDVYYNRAKISGILCTVAGKWVVISVGVNIHPVSVSNSVSLNEVSDTGGITADHLFKAILDEFDEWLSLPKINDFFGIREYWLENMIGINESVCIRDKKSTVYGVIRGIDDSGRLILEDNGNFLSISSGDMFLED